MRFTQIKDEKTNKHLTRREGGLGWGGVLHFGLKYRVVAPTAALTPAPSQGWDQSCNCCLTPTPSTHHLSPLQPLTPLPTLHSLKPPTPHAPFPLSPFLQSLLLSHLPPSFPLPAYPCSAAAGSSSAPAQGMEDSHSLIWQLWQ